MILCCAAAAPVALAKFAAASATAFADVPVALILQMLLLLLLWLLPVLGHQYGQRELICQHFAVAFVIVIAVALMVLLPWLPHCHV